MCIETLRTIQRTLSANITMARIKGMDIDLEQMVEQIKGVIDHVQVLEHNFKDLQEKYSTVEIDIHYLLKQQAEAFLSKLNRHTSIDDKVIWLTNIHSIVESVTGVSYSDLIGRRRDREFVYARYLFVRTVLEFHPHITLAQIGRYLNRDHSTIIHARTNGEYRYHDSPDFRSMYDRITEKYRIFLMMEVA